MLAIHIRVRTIIFSSSVMVVSANNANALRSFHFGNYYSGFFLKFPP